MNKAIGIIPARLGSSRFPGKPLKEICGMPMIGHCYMRAKLAKTLSEVYVATCDREIASYVESIGGKYVMTSDKHERASERTAEAACVIEQDSTIDFSVVTMLQGDEPLITPAMIDSVTKCVVENSEIKVANMASEIKDDTEFNDPNEVKVVMDMNGNAIYFSREAIPSTKKCSVPFKKYKQVCIIPFRKEFLKEYVKMLPTELEMVESVDMNRILEHGCHVKIVKSDETTYAVDTIEDLLSVEKIMFTDGLYKQYKL